MFAQFLVGRAALSCSVGTPSESTSCVGPAMSEAENLGYQGSPVRSIAPDFHFSPEDRKTPVENSSKAGSGTVVYWY